VRLFCIALMLSSLSRCAPCSVGISQTYTGSSASHYFGIATTGSILSWGVNNLGELGDGTTAPLATGTHGTVTSLQGSTIKQIAVGESHSIAFLSDGSVHGWGDDFYGQLGDGTTTINGRPSPILISALSGKGITQVAAGSYHSLALTSGGAVYAWGSNDFGQLGDGTTMDRYSPVLVGGISKVINKIFAGYFQSFAIANDGTIYTWGNCLNSTSCQLLPVVVNALGVKTITQIGIGYDTHVLYSDGSIVLFDIVSGNVTAVQPPSGKTIQQIYQGTSHTVALTSDGIVYAWGDNTFLQLGVSGIASSSSLVAVGGLGNKTISYIAAGNYFSTAAASDGTFFFWGNNAPADQQVSVCAPPPPSSSSFFSPSWVLLGTLHLFLVALLVV